MLRADVQWSNPLMFVMEIGARLTLLFVIQALTSSSVSQVPVTYFIALDIWLFLTVLVANFATALAQARGKAQAESLRTRSETPANRLRGTDTIDEVRSTDLKAGIALPQNGQAISNSILHRYAPRLSKFCRACIRADGRAVRRENGQCAAS
jgi:K+-transporting ATPase ATPase B chain